MSAEAVVETTKAVTVAETVTESVVSETQAQAMSIAEAIAPDSHCGSGSDGGNGWGSNDRWGVVDGNSRSGNSHGCGVNNGAGDGDRSSVNNGAGHGDRSSVNNGAGNGHYGAGNGDGSGDGVDHGPSDRYWSGNHGGRMVGDGSRGVVDDGSRGGGDGSSKDQRRNTTPPRGSNSSCGLRASRPWLLLCLPDTAEAENSKQPREGGCASIPNALSWLLSPVGDPAQIRKNVTVCDEEDVYGSSYVLGAKPYSERHYSDFTFSHPLGLGMGDEVRG
ncbi:hypothetical protein MRX96_026525 [Rhipicephalus microplus]